MEGKLSGATHEIKFDIAACDDQAKPTHILQQRGENQAAVVFCFYRGRIE